VPSSSQATGGARLRIRVLLIALVCVLTGGAVAGGPIALAQPQGPAPGGVRLTISPTSLWTDFVGQVHVVGYVHNDGIDVGNVQVLIDLLDSSGRTLRTDIEFVQNVFLRPGESSPFDHPFRPPTGYRTYRVREASAVPGVVAPLRALRVSSTAAQPTGSSPVVISGTVTNVGPERTDAAKIQVTFLDDGGTPRYVAGTVAVNSKGNLDIDPGQSAPWSIVRRQDMPTSWTHTMIIAEDTLISGDLQPAADTRVRIAAVSAARTPRPDAALRRHARVTNAGAAAPTAPVPDTRLAVTPVAPQAQTAAITTLARPRRLAAALGWSDLLLPLLLILGTLGLVFAVTLVSLAALRLRATAPGSARS
jgi:hypothetical protein